MAFTRIMAIYIYRIVFILFPNGFDAGVGLLSLGTIK